MVGELITLPLRVGVRVTQMWLRAAGEAVAVASEVANSLLERNKRPERPVTPATPATEAQGSGQARPRQAPQTQAPRTDTPRTETPPRTEVPPSTSAPARQVPPAAAKPARTLPPLDPEPVHVSEEPELVEEFAEPGAEDGAGAQIRIEEPWKGYAHSKVRDVIARIGGATPAELAAIELYESSHQARQTILAAVDRELRRANGSGSPTQERNR